jgi:murein DD-endopeptidase MepM/ murein hydrolase activator NlpD
VPASAAKYGHAHHDYPATDIFAPCGSEVVANVDGVVQEVSRVDTWDAQVNDGATRGGLFTSVVGDDGVRYYGSHLSAVAAGIDAGTRVTAGQRLGLVGNTGDARGIACHLHFGVSPACGPSDWEVRRGEVYPWPYLDSWRVGGRSSPAAAVAQWNAAHHAC